MELFQRQIFDRFKVICCPFHFNRRVGSGMFKMECLKKKKGAICSMLICTVAKGNEENILSIFKFQIKKKNAVYLCIECVCCRFVSKYCACVTFLCFLLSCCVLPNVLFILYNCVKNRCCWGILGCLK